MTKPKKKVLQAAQADYAKVFLKSIGTLENRKKMAQRIKETEGVSYETAMRRLQRYTTKAGQKRNLLKSPTVGKPIKYLPEEKPTGQPMFPAGAVSITGKIKVSEGDIRDRTIRFPLPGPVMRKFVETSSKSDRVEVINDTPDFDIYTFLRIDKIEVEI